jgi:tRNA (cytidine/uridine-2'-O-)-methyltransferase
VLHVALYQPEIPPNTGNIIRLCANTGAQLHLIHPLGFQPNDKQLERAGLDYHAWTSIKHYKDYDAFLDQFKPARLFACSTHGERCYTSVKYEKNDVFLLQDLSQENIIRIPMTPNSRSLNLSNAAAVVVYEAWRQLGFVNT